jgi:hypothetical protein
LTTVILIADLVEANPLPADPYVTLSARLMAAYLHTNSCSSITLL